MSATTSLPRIVDVAASPFSLPLLRPVRSAVAQWHERAGVLLRVEDAEGVVGYGEASPLPGLSWETPEQVHAAFEALDDFVQQSEAGFAVEAERSSFAASVKPLTRVLPPTARHALEQALLDLLAKRRGISVAAWLAQVLVASTAAADTATLPHERIPVHALVRDAAEAATAVAAGYGTLKVKIAADEFEDDVARLAAIRDAVGANVKLRLDANGALTVEEAVAALEVFARFDVECCEQPVAAHDITGLAEVRRNQPVPVAADEAVRTAADAQRILEAQAADILVLKPMLIGGLLPALEIAQAACAEGVGVYATTSLDAALGRAGAVHLAAALPGPLLACGLATGELLAADLAPRDALPVEHGKMLVPPGPGLGVEPEVWPREPQDAQRKGGGA